MGSKFNRVISLVLLALILFLSDGFVFSENLDIEEPLVFSHQITVGTQIYRCLWTYSHIRVFAEDGAEIFAWDATARNTIIKGVDYSRSGREFIFFTETFDPESRQYSLAMRGESVYSLVTDRSDKASYSPLLMAEEGEPEVIVYIEEGGTLVTFDPAQGVVIEREAFGKPISSLEKRTISGAQHLIVTLYQRGISESFTRRFTRISPRKQSLIIIERSDEAGSQNSMKGDRDEPPIQKPLDPKKVLCFGDSITYGVMDGVRDPSLGYVPRLELLANREFFQANDGKIINEGNPGETISKHRGKDGDKIAVNRYKGVLEKHLAKYLILHEGTNDTRFDDDLQIIYSDLEWMVGLALGIGIKPILSTLIPKDVDFYPNVTPRQLERGRKISSFIHSLGEELNLPVVDFWEIFSNHPVGYKNLMSDYVHPNEIGYQLMAEEWLKALPPDTPSGLEVVDTTPSQITIQWSNNSELDFSHYVLEYGFVANALDRRVELTDLTYTFYYNIMQAPFRSRVYFRLRAVDKSASPSDPTKTRSATFDSFTH